MGCCVRLVRLIGIDPKRHLKAPVLLSPPKPSALHSVPLAKQSRAVRQNESPAQQGKAGLRWQAAGSGSDTAARLIGQWLSERLGQQFVTENRPGAAGNIATEAVVRAPPDGHTLLLVNAGNAINATRYDKLNFNLDRKSTRLKY